jgi:hypothetical protein
MGWKTVALTAALLATPMTSPAQSLTVRVFNNYGVPDDDLLAARTHVDAIFNAAGTALSWLDCWEGGKEPVAASPECRRPLDATHIVLRLQAAQPVSGTRYISMGFSLVNLQTGVPFLATVFVDLVASISRGAAVDSRLLLGRAIAHEIGHLLLNTNLHAAGGLMRADWSRAELRRNTPADWTFLEHEIATIQASASGRTTPLSARALP